MRPLTYDQQVKILADCFAMSIGITFFIGFVLSTLTPLGTPPTKPTYSDEQIQLLHMKAQWKLQHQQKLSVAK